MSEISRLTELVYSTCEEHSLHVESALDGNSRLLTDQASNTTIFLELKDPMIFHIIFLQGHMTLLFKKTEVMYT